ncbi:MAG TPA: choice-of-anchor tandem repeat GloVer-containing protein [Rhizomicrobium sp.]|jgi:uncharacterized repeat protein (TIGR03803 family)
MIGKASAWAAATFVAAGVLISICPPAHARAGAVQTIYSFQGGTDGEQPRAPLIADAAGNLYGTASGGGEGCGIEYCGAVFKLTPQGSESLLHVFQGGNDGIFPTGGLLFDKAGNLYGTTELGGGEGGCHDGNNSGCGTVFELAPNGNETVLYRFTGGQDGSGPAGTLIADKKGNLFGTTQWGGSSYGVVFKVAPNGTETVLHTFAAGSDGAFPVGGLVADKKGNLYGVTSAGGSADDGVAFEVTTAGKEKILYNFCSAANCTDGSQPSGPLLADKSGDLYGTTAAGGAAKWGVVFKLAPAGTESVVYSFQGGSDGIYPDGGLIFDKKQNLYGVTYLGGASDDGTIFTISAGGSESVLYTFTGYINGENPAAALLLVKNTLYGTTQLGGAEALGNAFKLGK